MAKVIWVEAKIELILKSTPRSKWVGPKQIETEGWGGWGTRGPKQAGIRGQTTHFCTCPECSPSMPVLEAPQTSFSLLPRRKLHRLFLILPVSVSVWGWVGDDAG